MATGFTSTTGGYSRNLTAKMVKAYWKAVERDINKQLKSYRQGGKFGRSGFKGRSL
jgi:hypothetical protein